ncbi:alanine racemase [Paenarthrobacter sp. NPDC057355]|uniref:alanine racemase n=1 Tax=Paenarthrobacter sp. NPDC057355 TaxID=3346105 RepID=UPI00362AB699
MTQTVQQASPTDKFSNWLEVDGGAFQGNVRSLLAMLDGRALLCAVIKSDAYGHGADVVLPFLVACNVPYIGVGSNAEAGLARAHGFTGKLLRVRAAAPQEVHAGLPFAIEELVADPQSAREMSMIAAAVGQKLQVHLDINSSGISRHSLDVSSKVGMAQATSIANDPHLGLAGIMTHFPCDDPGLIEHGLQRFRVESAAILQSAGLPRSGILLHAANSFSALNVPSAWLDMVRAGAALYGDTDPGHSGFQRCLTFKARVGSVNSYPAGSRVGYGLTYTLEAPSVLATVTVGYGDGYRRALGHRGPGHPPNHVLLRGRRAPIVDLISMNSMVVDVTDIQGVRPGDEVVLFGRQGDAEISAAQLEAANAGILADLYTVWATGARVSKAAVGM